MNDDGNRRRLRRLSALVLCLAVFAPRAAALGKAAQFTATGEVRYEDKAWDFDGWTGLRPTLPVRRADVTVLDAQTGKTLGKGSTDLDGRFAVACRSKSTRDLVVRVDAATRHHRQSAGPFPRIRVRTPNGTQWSAHSATLSAHDPTDDAAFAPFVVEPVVVLGDEGNPFNVLDMAVAGFELVTAAPRSASPKRKVDLVWPNALGSFAVKRRAWIATDDGYDDAVILHEVGHLVHNVYSDSDNPGGSHVFGHSDQDPRLSFGEGYATFFAGAVLDALGREPVYLDCDGGAAFGGVQLRLRLENAAPYSAAAVGASDEVAVACVLHDLVDDEWTNDLTPGVDDDPFDSTIRVGADELSATEAWWRVFTKPVRRARNLTMNHAWDGWLKLHAEAPRADALKQVFAAGDIVFWDDETEVVEEQLEFASLPAPTPNASWGAVHTLYDSRGEAPEVDGVGVKGGAGDRDEWIVPLEAGQVVRIETRYPDGLWDAGTQVDPFVQLRRPNGKLAASDDDGGAGRNAAIVGFVVDESGPWRVTVRSKDKVRRYGRYQLRVTLDD